MQNMTTKKKIIYIAAAVVSVVIIAISTVVALKVLNSSGADTNKTQTPAPTAKEVTDAQKDEALQSLHNDPAKAKELLLELRQQYEEQGDTNGLIDVNAQLFLLDNAKTTD